MDQDTAGTVEASAGISGCVYEMAGTICGSRVRARGYCKRHYNLMARHGAFKSALQPGSAPTEGQVERNLGHLERARVKLKQHSEALVGHLLTAAENAAKKGDSGPAQWALIHARAIVPVLTGGGAAAGKGGDTAGIRVLIGVNLGGSIAASGTADVSASTVRTPQSIDAQSSQSSAQIAGQPDQSAPALPTITAELIPAE